MPRTAVLVLAVSTLLPHVPPAAGQGLPDLVTIKLFDNRAVTSVTLVAADGELTLMAKPKEEPLTVVQPGDSVAIVPASIGLRVRAGGVDINTDVLHAQPGEDGAIDVEMAARGQNTVRRYPGSITVSRTENGTLKVTNTVPIEEYVASVVGKEYGLGDVEGGKAMAVVARTFAVQALFESRAETGDGISAQVYHGLDGMTDESRAAANATQGLVLTYDDRPIMSVYSASNGGHTAQNSDVWSGAPLPYLRARRDRFDRAASPYNDWLSRLSKTRVHDALSDNVGATVTGFSIEKKSRDGRVKTVRAKVDGADDVEISGSEFRRILSGRFGVSSLRSTLFRVSTEGDHYVFEGSGYGHGVGLSQWGAHEMAERGYNFEEILRFYYDGAKTRAMTDLGFEPSQKLAAAETSTPDETPETDTVDPIPRRSSDRPGFGGWANRDNVPTSPGTKPRVGW